MADDGDRRWMSGGRVAVTRLSLLLFTSCGDAPMSDSAVPMSRDRGAQLPFLTHPHLCSGSLGLRLLRAESVTHTFNMAGLDSSSGARRWDVSFLSNNDSSPRNRRALIILNQPFSHTLLQRVWNTCSWRSCADGGANRLYDSLQADSPGSAGLKRSE